MMFTLLKPVLETASARDLPMWKPLPRTMHPLGEFDSEISLSCRDDLWVVKVPSQVFFGYFIGGASVAD